MVVHLGQAAIIADIHLKQFVEIKTKKEAADMFFLIFIYFYFY